MSRKLPEELAPALARTGHHWPQADEDGLRRAATAWREFGTDAEQLARRGAASAERVTGENSGRAIDAFADHWRTFAGGGRGHLDDARGAAEAMAGGLDKAAAAVDHCKAELISVLTELAEEIKQADAAEAKAKEQMSHAGESLGGLVGAAVGAVKDVVAEVGEAVAVEGAKLKIAGLLQELTREMKDAVQAAAQEPAVTALERIAQADGRGLHGEKREHSAARVMSAGTAGHAVGAKVARSVELAQVGEVHAAVDKNGAVKTDRHGNPVLVGADGREIRGVEGVQVAVGQDGSTQVVDADGRPVSGVALGEDGRPLRDSEGKPLLVGGSGVLLGTGLVLALSADGKPQLGTDGHPVLLGADGQPVAALAADRHGRLVESADGTAVTVGQDGRAVGPDGRAMTFDQHGRAVPLGDQSGVQVSVGGQPVLGVDSGGVTLGGDAQGNGPHGHHGKPGGPFGAQGPDGPDGRGGITVQAAGMSVGVQTPTDGGWSNGQGNQDQGNSWGNAHSSHGNGRGNGNSGGWSGGYQTPAAPGGGIDLGDDWTPPPVHHGPASVHTDSVAVAPQPTAPVADGDIWGGGGGGGHRAAEPPFGGGGSGGGGGGGHASAGNSGFQLGPVGGGSPLGGGPVAGGGVLGGPVGGGAVAAGPVGGPVGGPVAGATGSGPVGGAPAAGAAPGAATPASGAAPVQTGPVAGAQQGGSAAVIGVGQHTTQQAPGAAPRPPVGGPAQPGGGAIGQYTPVRYDPVPETGRRRDGTDGGPLSSLPVHPGQVAAAWLVWQTYRTAPPAPPAEPGTPRTIADSRPYGLPGGLGPVDPAHQADAVRRTPLPQPDPRAGDWIEALNGGGPREPGRANNCVDVALSGLDTVGGYPTCAAPRLPDGPAGERGGRDRAERELGTAFLDLGDGEGGFERVAGALRAAGGGSRAVLLTLDGFGRSHTWNAVHHGGEITWLDHLTGYRSDRPLYPADQGLWAIAVDAENQPLDLTVTTPATTAVPDRAAVPEPAGAVAEVPAPAPTEPVAAGAATPQSVPDAVPTAEVTPADAVPTAEVPASQPVDADGEPVGVPSGPAEPVSVQPRSRLTVHRTAGSAKR